MDSTQTSIPFPITNKYTFARIFSDPDNVKPLLEAVLEVPIGEIRYVVPEHGIEPSLKGHGVRMDVFVNDANGTVYDVEMQNADDGDLALRSRYLLSSFDRDRITRGEPYQNLGKSVVIFVCCFDPIGLGERMYAVIPMVSGHDEHFDDKTTRIFLNARGAAREHGGHGKLDAFLSYVDGGDTMGDEWVERLDREVHALNADEGWRDAMFNFDMDLQDAEYKGHQKGLEEGRQEGREQIAALARALREQGREDELAEAVLDEARMERLLAELGIA